MGSCRYLLREKFVSLFFPFRECFSFYNNHVTIDFFKFCYNNSFTTAIAIITHQRQTRKHNIVKQALLAQKLWILISFTPLATIPDHFCKRSYASDLKGHSWPPPPFTGSCYIRLSCYIVKYVQVHVSNVLEWVWGLASNLFLKWSLGTIGNGHHVTLWLPWRPCVHM